MTGGPPGSAGGAASPGGDGTGSNPRPNLNSPLEVTRVLHQALSELEHVKKQLRQPFLSKANVEASLNRLQHNLAQQAQEVIIASAVSASQQSSSQQTHSPVRASVQFKVKPAPKPIPSPPAADEKVALQKANPMEKPQTLAARQYLQERFGVPAPSRPLISTERKTTPTAAGGNVSKGLTSTALPAVILPRHFRDDPYALPPAQYTDIELQKGLLHLVNRGLLPTKADLTPALVGNTGAVKMQPVHMHEHKEQFARGPVTSALEDSLIASTNNQFKLDLLTPVVKPATPAHQPPRPGMKLMTMGPTGPSGLPQVLQALQPPPSPPADPAANAVVGAADAAAANAEARPYDALMDVFSLHEFMIRKGSTLANTPEFDSYRRTYEQAWPAISELIQRLEALCLQYDVPLAVVDGKSLADLAASVLDSGYAPTLPDLLACLKNVQQVANLLKQPGRRFQGPVGSEKAASLIQAHYRGHLARRKHSKAGMAAGRIQNAWRNMRLRQQVMDRLQQARQERDQRYAAMQQQLYQQWPLIQRHHHVAIHVPCMHRNRLLATSVQEALLLQEAAQMARLCDLAEPLLEVILVLPEPPDNDVVNYWSKILEVGGVEEPGSRFRIIFPENHQRLPPHMSTTAKLLASPRALKRIRAAVQGRMAYLVPGTVNDEDVDLAVQLGVPLLAAQPSTAKTLTRKSASRALIRSVGVNIAPGIDIWPRAKVEAAEAAKERLPVGLSPLKPNTEFTITPDGDVIVTEALPTDNAPSRTQYEQDEARIIMLLAEAMVRSPSVGKWLMKVNDDLLGTGHAFFETLSIAGAADVLTRVVKEDPSAFSSSDPAVPLTEPQKVAMYRLNELLYRQLPRKLSLAAREVYPTYRDYMTQLATRGGVIEACPALAVGSPSANIFIDPLGTVSLLSTHEKIFVYPYRALGTTFPQSSVPHRALLECVNKIGRACFQAGVIGHLAVDFVTLQEDDGSLRLWAVDLNPQITPSLMSFQLFDFLTAGTFNPQTGTYTVELDIPDAPQSEAAAAPEAEAAPAASDAPAVGTGVGSGPAPGSPPGSAGLGLADLGPAKAMEGSIPPSGDATLDLGLGLGPGPLSDTSSPPPTAGGGQRSGSAGPASSSHGASGSHGPAASGVSSKPLGPSLRFYFCLDTVVHPAIKATPCPRFFHSCWQQGFHYDVDNRVGVIFNLSDKYLFGALGLMAVGLMPVETYSTMLKVLNFVAQRPVDVSLGERAAWALSHDLAVYKDLVSLVKFLADAGSMQQQQIMRAQQQAHAQLAQGQGQGQQQ